MTFHGALDISNGPPGYYQSLPQSSYGYSKETLPRYSSTAETISNFMNGSNSNKNGNEHTFNSYNSLRRYNTQFRTKLTLILLPFIYSRPSSNYMEMTADSFPYSINNMNKTTAMSRMSPSRMNNYSGSNYEYMRYNSISSSTYPNVTNVSTNNFSQTGPSMNHNQGLYLNVPYPSKPFTQEPNLGHAYSMSSSHNQSSPLPPPPPLPSYPQHSIHPNASQLVVQPTPQQPQPGQYLDLSLNRENRGSAFEIYRKPIIDPMHHLQLGENQLFQGLPPPPPPLAVNDYK